jgi:TonB family protein
MKTSTTLRASGTLLLSLAHVVPGLAEGPAEASTGGRDAASLAEQAPPEIPREVIRRADGSLFKFAAPRVVRAPRYPGRMADMGAEGWVVMSFVVTRDGTVRDPVVLDSSRHEFERPALEAVRSFIYEPAEVDGQPLETAVSRYRITFVLDPPTHAARPDFARRFQLLERHIRQGDLEKAGVALANLESFGRANLYEDAFYWWARAMYYSATGAPELRRESLLRAIAYAGVDGRSGLPAAMHARGLTELYGDYIRTAELAAALDTYRQLAQRVGKDKVSQELHSHAASVRALLESDAAIEAQGHVASDHPWHHRLSRDSFEFAEIQGELHRLSLWCEQRAVELEIDPESSWQVPASWGACEIYVSGEPGTRFNLVEYSSDALP